MDVQDKLTQIIRLVEDARAMPMSASCLVNREEMLAELDELRSLLPEQLQQADVVLSDRDAVVERGRDAAQRLLDQARAEHDRLVEEQAVVIGARERAAIVLSEANAESTRLLSDADDYVDRKLAEFEIALQKLTQQVVRGRARLGARRAADLGRLSSDESDQLGEPGDDTSGGSMQPQVSTWHGSHERLPDDGPAPAPPARSEARADESTQDAPAEEPGEKPDERPDEADG
jgi:cell division septum initiation protein DivIVA